MDNKILWIFLHPPRTAGGSLVAAISKKFHGDEVFDTSLARYKLNSQKLNKDKVKFIVGHATYYGIHKLVPNKIPRYFILLRDPVERLVSNYNVKMDKEKNIIPFDKWYKNQIKNELVHVLDLKFRGSESTRINVPKPFLPILRRLNYKTFYFIQAIMFNLLGLNKRNNTKKLENAKKLLDLCWFIGLVEKDDKDLKFLIDVLGIKDYKWKMIDPPYKKFLTVDDKLRKKIYEENPLDFELYKYALALRDKKKELIKNGN